MKIISILKKLFIFAAIICIFINWKIAIAGFIMAIMCFLWTNRKNDESLGEKTINEIETIFLEVQRQHPNEDIHVLLANTWINWIKTKGKDISDPSCQTYAYSVTWLHACIEPPLCARSLGLYLLAEGWPHLIIKNPKFAEEYKSLMGPIFKAEEETEAAIEAGKEGSINPFYRKFNPKMCEEIDKGFQSSNTAV